MIFINLPKISTQNALLQEILFLMSQIKDKQAILKVAREEKISHIQGDLQKAICIFFLTEIFQAKRDWNDLVLKEKNCKPRIFYLAKLSFRNERQTFPNKQKSREFITTRPVLQEMLKGTMSADGMIL